MSDASEISVRNPMFPIIGALDSEIARFAIRRNIRCKMIDRDFPRSNRSLRRDQFLFVLGDLPEATFEKMIAAGMIEHPVRANGKDFWNEVYAARCASKLFGLEYSYGPIDAAVV